MLAHVRKGWYKQTIQMGIPKKKKKKKLGCIQLRSLPEQIGVYMEWGLNL